MTEVFLEAEGLGKRYGSFELSGVSFRLEPGAVMGLIGPNGAGKTTTIRLLLGLVRPDAGTARLFGTDPIRRGAELMEKVGFVYEDGCFYGSLSACDNGRWLSRVYRTWDGVRYRDLLGRFGVDPDRKVDALSKGQRTKMSLAAALSHEADLLILDEPTSGLDPVSRSEILDLLYEYIGNGSRSVLFSTHITADLERIADYVTFLREGTQVWSEETEAVLEDRALVRGSISALDAVRPHLLGVRVTESGFEGLCERRPELGSIGGLVVEKPSLDDIIVYSTREDYRVWTRA